MYARIVTCTLHTEKREDFNHILCDQVLPILKEQPGFVDLFGMVSEEQPDNMLGIALWNSKENADHFYTHSEPLLDSLKPILAHPPLVEHYHVHTSLLELERAATGKAA